jgi:uncharacterized protein (TIGR03437 family)
LAPGVQADSVDFTIAVTPSSGAATYTDTLGNALASDHTTYVSVLYNNTNVTAGTTALGSINFTLPNNATGGQTFMAYFTGAEVSYQTNDVTPVLDYSSTSTVTVIGPVSITAPGTGAGTVPLTPQATAGEPYTSPSFTATGGNSSFTWSLISGSLPSGLSISTTSGTGLISGTVNSNATVTTYNFTVQVTDSETTAKTASQAYSLVVNAKPSNITPTTLTAATQSVSYTSQNITVSGGTAPYTWSTTPANLLTTYGLSLSGSTTSTTTISGTPNQAVSGGLTIPLTVTDAHGASTSANLTLVIGGPLALAPANSSSLAIGTQGYPYTTGSAIAASGGTQGSGYIYSVNGGLPAGLGISSTTGAITGTPTVNGTFSNVQVTVTDHATPTAASVTNTYTIVIDAPITLTPAASLPNGTTGVLYDPANTLGFSASGGSGSYKWSIAGLPGVTIPLAGSSVTLGGSPSAQSTGSGDTVTVTVTDATYSNVTASQTYNNVVIALAVSILTPANNAALPAATLGIAYPFTAQTANITTTGGTAPYTWSVTSGALPGGLSLAPTTANGPTGAITGTPSGSTGKFTFTVQVSDTNGSVSSMTYSITLYAAPVLTTGTLPVATEVSTYSSGATNPIGLAGGAPTIVWTTLQALPSGLIINGGTGVITGTPALGTNASSPYTINFKVTDGNGATATTSSTLTIDPQLKITPASLSLPAVTVKATWPVAPTLAATGGNGSYTWSTTGTALSTLGLSISAGGVITGSPQTAGTYTTLPVTVTDSTGAATTGNLSLTVNAAPAITSPATAATLQGATVGKTYSATVVSTNGTGPYTWSTNPVLPTGLSIAGNTGATATATISGTPQGAVAATNYVVTVTDADSVTATATYSLQLYAAPVVGGTSPLPIATVGSVYTSGSNITLTGGAPTITWTAAPLPAGLSINGSGVITGTPTTNSGSPFTVSVTAKDVNNATSSQNFTLTVNPALKITPGTLPLGIPSVVYTTTTLVASGGSGSGYTFTSSGLPPGLSLSSAGVLSGTPTTSTGSPYTVNVTVTDSTPASVTIPYTIVIAPPLSISGPSSLPAGVVNVVYNATAISATGGSGIYSWAATNLPPGLSINSNSGVIAGTPLGLTGTPFSVVVTVTDTYKTTATKTFSLSVSALPLTVTIGLLPNGVVGVPYPYTAITAQGGVGNYSFTVTGLPPGLTTDGSGDITGTPTTTVGSPFTVTVTVTDSVGTSLTKTYTLTISGVLTVAGPSTLPAATLSSAYAGATVTAGGGASPYTFAATGLPAGMTIGLTTGAITGTPTSAAGSPYSVTVTVTDSVGKTAVMNYSLVVNSPLLISGPASLPAGTAGSAYTSTTVTASGGSTVYTFSATGLPTGLTIGSTTGAITGTPAGNSAGPYTVVVTVTDSTTATAAKTYSLTINPPQTTLPLIAGISTSAGGELPIAPNTWVTIYGSNFTVAGFTDNWTNAIKNSSTGSLPTVLDGVSVMVGTNAAYVNYISATQINVLMPNIGLGPLQVTVTTTAGISAPYTVTAQQDIPGFFAWPNSSGLSPGDSTQQPVATHLDYSDAVANGTFAGTVTVAAKPGETIILWGSGFGPTTPANPFGVAIPSTQAYNTSSNVTVMLNGAPIAVYQNVATLSAGSAGLYQVGVTIPASLANGSYPITTSVNGVTSPTLTLVVHN